MTMGEIKFFFDTLVKQKKKEAAEAQKRNRRKI